MVNAPGNLFHPMDFAREIMEHMKETSVECELIVYSKLNAMGMEALTSVGKSSEKSTVYAGNALSWGTKRHR